MVAKMVDGQTALIQAHYNNIRRYQRLLMTRLTDVERQYIEARLSEEQTVLASLPAGQNGTNAHVR